MNPREPAPGGGFEKVSDGDVLDRLQRAYGTELIHARRDVGGASPSSVSAALLTKGVQPDRRTAVPRPSVRIRVGPVGAAVLALLALALIPLAVATRGPRPELGVGQSGLQTAAASVPSAASVAPTASADPTRYGDGIPRTWDGEAVLRGQAALDEAAASVDSTPFLVAFWAGIEPPHSCLAHTAADVPLYVCGGMMEVGDAPGVRSPELGAALRVNTGSVVPGPVIARVHTHDPALSKCPVSYASSCEHTMVGENIVWSGDGATTPRPTTVEQAASAFGVAATATNSVCEGEWLPGIAVLRYPSSGDQTAEAVIAVFPSAAALASAMPDAAAHGESDVPPSGSPSCAHSGTDPARGEGTYPLSVRWLARGNVLVGAEYDTALGSDKDPIVARLRAILDGLPSA